MIEQLTQYKSNVDERFKAIGGKSSREVGSAIATLAEELGYKVGKEQLDAQEASEAVTYLYIKFGLTPPNEQLGDVNHEV
jgi:hypothetical protein